MIPVSRLVGSMRFQLRDTQGVQYSDFELVEALNQAARLLFQRLGARLIWAAVKKEVLTIASEAASTTLPADFHNVRRVSREDLTEDLDFASGRVCPVQYRIAGEAFYGAPGTYGLEYFYLPADVSSLTDELDAPPVTRPWLEQAGMAVLKGDAAGAAEIAEACCNTLAAGEVSRFADGDLVNVLGGKLP